MAHSTHRSISRLVGSAAVAFLVATAACAGDAGTEDPSTTIGPAAATTTTPQTLAPVDTEPATTTPVTTTPLGAQDCPEVLAVEMTEDTPGVFNVSTTVRSVDIEGVSYADAWEVRDLDGAVLGVRVLTHPHANEQPFTRSLSNVNIPVDILEVEVVAQDSVRGFCGVGLVVAVPHS